MAAQHQVFILVILLLASGCTSFQPPQQLPISEARLSHAILGRWYDGDPTALTYFYLEFRGDGSCGYYVVHSDSHFVSGLSSFGTWSLQDGRVTFHWHPVPRWGTPVPVLDGSIRSADSDRLELTEPWGGSYRVFFSDRFFRTHRPNQALQPTVSQRTDLAFT